MDVSASVNELNEEIVKSLKEVVQGLKGERFGITIFNNILCFISTFNR